MITMNEQQLKEAFMQYLQQKSGAQTQQEFEAYIQQLGEEGLQQEYAQFMQIMQQQQVAARKFGGMLNYIGKLRGVCPEGYEMQFFKQGGQICKKCIQKAKMEEGGKTPENPIDAFRCGRKMKKKKENGGNIEMDRCGKKMKKKACGGPVKKDQTGGPLQRDVKAVSVNGSNYMSNPAAKRFGRNALGAALGRNATSTTVNWSDGTSTSVDGRNRIVTGRDGIPYQMNTAQADSVMRNDIAGPYQATYHSGQPFQINDRSRRMGASTFKR